MLLSGQEDLQCFPNELEASRGASCVLDRSMMVNPAAVSILWTICRSALSRPS